MKNLSVTLSKKAITFGLIYWAVQIIALPQALTRGNWILGNPFSISELNFIFFVLNFIVITVAFRDFLIQNFKILLQNPWRVLRYAGAGLVLYWVTSFLVNFVILLISPEFFNVNDQSIAEMTQENYVLMGVGTVLLVPVAEETLYRGVIFSSLYQKKPVLALCVSTLLFSVIHILGYVGTFEPLQLLLCTVQYIPAGLILAWSYTKADCIWAPILIHIAVNQASNLSMR